MPPAKFDQPVFVTRPFLPPLESFRDGLAEIWERRWLTNDGPVLKRFEDALAAFHGTESICVFNNGTLALQIGLQGLGIAGEVITTPFTFVATVHSLFWNNIRPVFCDISPDSYNLDPDKVERLITPWTRAILAVHTFGRPCDHEALSAIADKHNLALIYDAAHAFGVERDGQLVAQLGDMSMISFHATKPFHSFEGGMLLFKEGALKKKLNYLKNFGFENEVEVVMPGTNAKMSEVHALMGLMILERFPAIMEQRTRVARIYRERLSEVPGISMLPEPARVKHNYSYFAVTIDSSAFGVSRDAVYHALRQYNVFSRRYFYPLIPDYPCYRSVPLPDPLENARRISSEILTLPIFPELPDDDVHRICDMLAHIQKNGH